MSWLKLTRAQRAKLFAGEAPNISGKGKCPVEAGYVMNLSSKVSLKVLRVVPTQSGWRLLYLVTDKRDQVRNLRHTPGIGREDFKAMRRSFEYGYPKPPTEEEIEQAAQESAYTAIGAQVPDAGEGIAKDAQNVYSLEAEQTAQLEGGRRERERQTRWERAKRIQRVEALSRTSGIDVSTDLRAIDRRLEAAERKLGRRAA